MDTIKYKFVKDSPEHPHSINDPSPSFIEEIYFSDDSQLDALNAFLQHKAHAVRHEVRDVFIIYEESGITRPIKTILHKNYHVVKQSNDTILALSHDDFMFYYGTEWRLTNKFVFDGIDFSHKRFTTLYAAPTGENVIFRKDWFKLFDEDQKSFICMLPHKDGCLRMISHPYLEGGVMKFLADPIKMEV